MRKLYLFNFITLDGYFEGPNHELDWHNVDDEFQEFAIDQLNHTDLLLFGRVTYEMMASYWTTEMAIKSDPVVASKMNSLPKIVFSKTLGKADWNNTQLIKENVAGKVAELKQQSGEDIAVLGSSNLAVTLAQHSVIDEYRIMVNPVVLGVGVTLLKGINERLNFRLLKTKLFKSGNVLLYYGTKPK